MIDNKVLDSLVIELIKGKVSVIVGSGASDYKKFGAPTLKQKLLDTLKLEPGGKSQLRVNALSHINREPSECSLEELLSIYSNIYGKPIDLFLKQQGIRSKSEIDAIPLLSCEILSHFIKQRLIDHVVSFNFDEYLEVSLDNEIGEDGYEWVRSVSIFQKVTEDIEHRIGASPLKPLLIKPHGTITYPVTIRPTFDTVQQFEKEKQKLLETIFDNSTALVILGFSCPDADFHKVLKKLILTKGKKIYWVDIKEDFQYHNEMFKFAKKALQNNCIFVKAPVDDFLLELADYLHQNYKERYPAITQHKFRDKFSKWGALKSVKDMFWFEIIIYAIKTRGMFSLEGFLTCKRIDNYCEKITKYSIKETFEEIVNKGIFKKNNQIRSAEVYYIPIFNHGTTFCKEVFRMFSIEDKNGSKQKLLSGFIEELMQDFDFDFGGIDNYLYLKFYEPKIIEDYYKLYEYTKSTIKSAKKEINIITETGEWILRDAFKPVFEKVKNRIKINLILAEVGPKDDSHSKVQKEKHNKLKAFFPAKSLVMKYLPWNEHNAHMTITEVGSGIYFNRKYKSPVFTPIYINQGNKRDCGILKDEFNIFNRKAYTRS